MWQNRDWDHHVSTTHARYTVDHPKEKPYEANVLSTPWWFGHCLKEAMKPFKPTKSGCSPKRRHTQTLNASIRTPSLKPERVPNKIQTLCFQPKKVTNKLQQLKNETKASCPVLPPLRSLRAGAVRLRLLRGLQPRNRPSIPICPPTDRRRVDLLASIGILSHKKKKPSPKVFLPENKRRWVCSPKKANQSARPPPPPPPPPKW